MRNPFQYGTVVRGEAFCNRREEQKTLRRAIENGDKLFVYSERRLGKTSLVRTVLDKLPKKKFLRVYVDLWPTDSEASFVEQTGRAMAGSLGTTANKILEAVKTFFGSLAPSISLDDSGKPTLTVRLGEKENAAQQIEEVLSVAKRVADRGDQTVVVVFDECQRILEYGSDLVERKLRSTIQHHDNVCYIFLGSRKHLVQKMFLDKSRPLYRAAGHYPLEPIESKHWVPFIRTRFLDAKKGVEDEQIQSLCERTEGHPFYTQHLCHALWEQCEPGKKVTDAMVDAALDTLLAREGHAYTTLWESFAMNQRRFLTGLATTPRPVQPFSSAFVRDHGLRSASNAQRAADALMDRDVIDRDHGSFLIVDRFFKLWIQRAVAP